MTQQELVQHPFWGMMQNRIGPVINSFVQRGFIRPNESQMLVQLLKNSGNELMNFVNGLIMRYPAEMNAQQMDQELAQWLQGPINMVRQRMQQMMNNGGYGFGGGGFGGGGFGGVRPSGFGYDPGFGGGRVNNAIPAAPFSGNNQMQNKDVFSAPGTSPMSEIFGGGTAKQPTERDKHVQEEMQKKVNSSVKPIDWKEPEFVDENSYEVGDVTVLVSKYNLYTGDTARRIIVHDPKVGYTSDQEVIEKYKPIFDIFPDSKKKMLTIAYQQLRAIPVNREEFMKMAQTISIATNRASDVEGKLRAIIATLGHFNLNAVEQFKKLFLDELELHIQCGELCDSFHPKNILNRPDKIETVLAWVTGDIDKGMLSAMHGMKGFEERLNQLLTVIIETIVTSLPKLIINTNTDMTMLDDFYHALPGIWTSDCGATLQNANDLVNIFLATRETINGSKTDNAAKSETVLKKTLDELGKQFTLIFIPRVTTWCNYAKSEICRYDEQGNCQPACWAPTQPRNDVEFFLSDILEKWDDSKDTRMKWSPKSIYMNIDEETFWLMYGKTTNDCPYCGQSKFWK